MNEKEEKLELYKILVQSINNNENKRIQMNMLYTTIIVAVITYSSSSNENLLIPSILIFILSYIWNLNIDNYRNLSKAKFKILLDLEKSFIIDVFNIEWLEFKKIMPKNELTIIESRLPKVFMIISAVFICYKLILFFYKTRFFYDCQF